MFYTQMRLQVYDLFLKEKGCLKYSKNCDLICDDAMINVLVLILEFFLFFSPFCVLSYSMRLYLRCLLSLRICKSSLARYIPIHSDFNENIDRL